MIFVKNNTSNLPITKKPVAKQWTSLGDGEEILTKIVAEVNKNSSDEIIENKKFIGKLNTGDLIYYEESWASITSLTNDKATIKAGDKSVEIPISECRKAIKIQILFCAANSIFLHVIPVNGNTILSQIGKKLSKTFSQYNNKSKWYFAGKQCSETATIESIKIKPNGKISCIMAECNIKTFKRFQELDTTRGWYMSRSNPDAICFVATKAIRLFGFGMYHIREGPGTYTLHYELMLDSNKAKEGTVIITKPDESTQIEKIFFEQNHESIKVSAGTRMTIVVKYPDYNESSRLLVGNKGDEYDTFEGNIPGLFIVEESSSSENGTDINAGQIPELYYSLSD